MSVGKGRIISICDVESPPAYPIISQMNFGDEAVKSVLSSLNWATADETYTLSPSSLQRYLQGLILSKDSNAPYWAGVREYQVWTAEKSLG